MTEFQALITGAVHGALMRASAPSGPFLIDVELPERETGDGYGNEIYVTGRESGEQLKITVEPRYSTPESVAADMKQAAAIRERFDEQLEAERQFALIDRSLALGLMTENQRIEFHRIVAAREDSSPASSRPAFLERPVGEYPPVMDDLRDEPDPASEPTGPKTRVGGQSSRSLDGND